MVEITGLVLDNVDNGQYGAIVYIGDADGNKVYTAPEGINYVDLDGKFKIQAPDDVYTSGTKYLYSKNPKGGNDVKKQELQPYTSYQFVWDLKKAKELVSVDVNAKSLKTQCDEKGGRFNEKTKLCLIDKDNIKSSFNWKKTLIIGSVILIVLGGTILYVKSRKN